MKKLLTALCLFAAGSASLALAQVAPNIHQGNFKTGGSFYYGTTTSKGAQSEYYLGSTTEYFVMDHLALGGDFSVERGGVDGDHVVSLIGPAASYYFLESNQITAYAEFKFLKGLTDNTIQARYMGGVGLQYFITPSVAIGPSFYSSYVMRQNTSNNYWTYYFYVNFGLYL
ncbi:MAG: hypothetical protein JST16_15465 [Bdellovibrionales bacterium]|nr:hypothetical protein [Bdellovibrionales bacterium]